MSKALSIQFHAALQQCFLLAAHIEYHAFKEFQAPFHKSIVVLTDALTSRTVAKSKALWKSDSFARSGLTAQMCILLYAHERRDWEENQ